MKTLVMAAGLAAALHGLTNSASAHPPGYGGPYGGYRPGGFYGSYYNGPHCHGQRYLGPAPYYHYNAWGTPYRGWGHPGAGTSFYYAQPRSSWGFTVVR